LFNTTGPGKTNDVTSDFISRAFDVKEGKLPVMKVGNLKTRRAIMDVRDLLTALVLLSDKGTWGEAYNVSGDKVYVISELLPIIEKILNIKLPVETDKQLIRPSDEPVIYGDSSKLKKDTGWQQNISLEQTARDMITYALAHKVF
jgi:nucleoside-diphosphate-sugar epimerase